MVCGAEVRDRLVLGVDARHLRLEDAVGQVAADLRDRVPHVVDGAVGRRAELELDEGRAVALGDGAVDLVDAVDAADRGFDPLGDLGLHLVRCRARLADADDRRREVDVGVVVHLHPRERDQAGEHQADEQDDRDDRVADAPGRDVAEIHVDSFLRLAAQRTASRSDSPFAPD